MKQQQQNTLITVVGPTAIGKTALSIKLAKHFNCDIISSDSRQFFKEMKIGTAVPENHELAAATHHFIQDRSIFQSYNVGDFERDVLTKLNSLFTKNNVQIMVGGSGLYVDAVLEGLDYFPEVSASIREKLTDDLAKEGIKHLQERLRELDIETYNNIELENPHRIMRALEICIGTNKTYSSFKNKTKTKRNFKNIKIGLTADRQIIYDRINLRVDLMIKNGLIEEAERLYEYKDLNALQTVGYRELFEYFDGNFSKEFSISEIKKNTRRFAKRQLTWFKRDQNTVWFDFKTKKEIIINYLEDSIKNT